MSFLYTHQSALRVQLVCGTSLASITSAHIKMMDSAGSATTWTATVSDASSGTIYYDLTTALTVAGPAKFWTYVIFSDGRIGIGDVVSQDIKTEGK
jgi:hypothetical protein